LGSPWLQSKIGETTANLFNSRTLKRLQGQLQLHSDITVPHNLNLNKYVDVKLDFNLKQLLLLYLKLDF
jgi:hypothetical protein